MKPTQYFVEWSTRQDHIQSEDAPNLERAYAIAEHYAQRAGVTTFIYERIDFDPPIDPRAPWLFDTSIIAEVQY